MAEHVRRGIAYQIRAMRDQVGWSQGKFAGELKKPQSVVSRLEDPGYGKVTVQTLLEVAKAFDVALQIRFVNYSLFLRDNQDRTATALRVTSFNDDIILSTGGVPAVSAAGSGGGKLWLKLGKYTDAESVDNTAVPAWV